jgi:hypothetical protein
VTEGRFRHPVKSMNWSDSPNARDCNGKQPEVANFLLLTLHNVVGPVGLDLATNRSSGSYRARFGSL